MLRGLRCYRISCPIKFIRPFSIASSPVGDLKVHSDIQSALSSVFHISKLTDVQRESFEPISSGKDIVAKSRTGTGKTLAFLLPLINKLASSEARKTKAPAILILEPTRELARQVHVELEKLTEKLRRAPASVCIYGGVAYGPQESALQRGVDVVIGTPGRILDHIKRGTLNLGSLTSVVLDESDEMLKMGFKESIDEIFASTPRERQLLLFSATVPDWVRELSRRYAKKPQFLDVVGDTQTPVEIKHYVYPVHQRNVSQAIRSIVNSLAPNGKVIVFTKTKAEASSVAFNLGSIAGALHGDIGQGTREIVMRNFRTKHIQILVATDVAARGIDVPNVELIIQTWVDEDPKMYVHRAGRTGRAGKTGQSVLLYHPNDAAMVGQTAEQLGIEIYPLKLAPTDILGQARKFVAGFKPTPAVTEAAEKLIDEFGTTALAKFLTVQYPTGSSMSQNIKERVLVTAENSAQVISKIEEVLGHRLEGSSPSQAKSSDTPGKYVIEVDERIADKLRGKNADGIEFLGVAPFKADDSSFGGFERLRSSLGRGSQSVWSSRGGSGGKASGLRFGQGRDRQSGGFGQGRDRQASLGFGQGRERQTGRPSLWAPKTRQNKWSSPSEQGEDEWDEEEEQGKNQSRWSFRPRADGYE